MKNKLPFSVSVCSKQMKVCHFRFLFAANKRKLPISVISFFCINGIYIYIETATYMYICCSFKQKTEAQVIFLHQFTVCSSYKWKFLLVSLLMKKQTEVIPLQTDQMDLSAYADK
jgi:hypothetical protein